MHYEVAPTVILLNFGGNRRIGTVLSSWSGLILLRNRNEDFHAGNLYVYMYWILRMGSSIG
jgi:hypothetical protein